MQNDIFTLHFLQNCFLSIYVLVWSKHGFWNFCFFKPGIKLWLCVSHFFCFLTTLFNRTREQFSEEWDKNWGRVTELIHGNRRYWNQDILLPENEMKLWTMTQSAYCVRAVCMCVFRQWFTENDKSVLFCIPIKNWRAQGELN